MAIEKKTGKEVALRVINNMDVQNNILREIDLVYILDFLGIVKLIGFCLPLTKESKDELSTKGPTALKRTMIFKGKKVDVSGAIIVTELKNGCLDLIVHKYLKNEGKWTEKLNPTIRSKIIFGIAATMKRIHKLNLIHKKYIAYT